MPPPLPDPYDARTARPQQIDAALEAAGWVLQDASHAAVKAAKGVAVREFSLKAGHGVADYLLYVEGQAVGRGAGGE